MWREGRRQEPTRQSRLAALTQRSRRPCAWRVVRSHLQDTWLPNKPHKEAVRSAHKCPSSPHRMLTISKVLNRSAELMRRELHAGEPSDGTDRNMWAWRGTGHCEMPSNPAWETVQQPNAHSKRAGEMHEKAGLRQQRYAWGGYGEEGAWTRVEVRAG